MSPITHALLPLLFGLRWIPKHDHRPSGRVSALVAVSGILPDLLSPHIDLGARYTSPPHSLLGLGVFAVVVTGVRALRKKPSERAVGILCVAAYAAHLACDAITGGVPLLLPFSRAIVGRNHLPYWSWDVTDALLLLFVYVAYRWLPLRRRHADALRRPEPAPVPKA